VPEGAPVRESTRPAPVAFGRGLSQVVANPGLVLAPVAFGVATLAVFFGLGAAAFIGAHAFFSSRMGTLGGAWGFPGFLEGLRDLIFASPLALVLVFLAILVCLLLLTLLAGWLRAGLTGALVAADGRAPEGASPDAFRLPSPARTFFRSAGERFGSFFALVNLYGLVASFLAAFLVVPAVVLFVAVIAGRTGLAAACGVLLVVALVAAVVGGGAARIVYLAAGRAIAAERLDALTAVARGIAQVRETPGRAVTLYLLTIAGGIAVGLAFVLPRLVATFAVGVTRAGAYALLGITGFFFALQTLVTLAYDAAVTGAFVALWPQERNAPRQGSEPLP
jgi:hypothetical protein